MQHNPIALTNVKVGDWVLRMLAGTIPCPLQVSALKDGLVLCGTPDGTDAWSFDIATGAEVDAYLQWGPKFGKTGSFISATAQTKEELTNE